MSVPAAVLLRYSSVPDDLSAVPHMVDEAVRHFPSLFERVDANRALDGSYLYLYFWSGQAKVLNDEVVQFLQSLAARSLPMKDGGAPSIVRLSPAQDMPGASCKEPAHYHYVVETDLQAQFAADLIAWYEQEHLPGLAAVQGNVRARRLETVAENGGVRSLACYDLTTPATLETAPWLAVRATAWSSRVRPYFSNSRRVMCERIFLRELDAVST